LSKAQIASITECPDDRYAGGISNFSRFENPHPTTNVNDTRYVDASGRDVDATAFCKQRGFSTTSDGKLAPPPGTMSWRRV
jgi:hypothetical protein